MDKSSQQTKTMPPTFGLLSVFAPVIGAFLFYFTELILCDFIPFAFLLLILIVPMTPLCGIGFAIMSWLRHERYFVLAYIGLILNLVFGYFCIVNLFKSFKYFSFG